MPRWKDTNDEIQRLKRDAVIKEAGRAFSKRGYHNTSLDDVARALQVSKGTLYNYVKDKQEILYECHVMALAIGVRAFEIGRAAGGSGANMLDATLTSYIEMLTNELGACGVLMEVDALRPEDREQIAAQRDQFEKNFVGMLKAGIADGSIRPVDPKLAVFMFMGAINWMPRWFSPEGRLTGQQLARELTDLLLTGLLPAETARAVPAPRAAAPARKATTKAARKTGRAA